MELTCEMTEAILAVTEMGELNRVIHEYHKTKSALEYDNCLTEILTKLGRGNKGETLKCSVAVCAAWSDDVSDLKKLVSIADKRMYEDKQRQKRERKE